MTGRDWDERPASLLSSAEDAVDCVTIVTSCWVLGTDPLNCLVKDWPLDISPVNNSDSEGYVR